MSIVNRHIVNIRSIADWIMDAGKLESSKDKARELAKLNRMLQAEEIYLMRALRNESQDNELS